MLRAWFLGLVACVLAAPVRAGDDAPPNVLLIISDDQGWDDYGFLGHPVIETPHLDALAARSLVFDRGYVASPLCRPSLASIATGLHPHRHGVVANDVDPKRRAASDTPVRAAFHELPSLMRLLGEAGYLTHQSGKWWEGSYADGGFTHGMTHGDPARRGRHGDAGLRIGRQGLAPVTGFVDAAVEQERPFFLWYAPFLPHTPHNPPAELLARYQAEGRPANVAKYYAMCTWFDQTCGELLGHLEGRGVLDDTLVVYVCDNGWAPIDRSAENPPGWWTDFAPRSKGSPFERGIRTPILLSWPGQVAPTRSTDLASSLDLMPTILAASGVGAPGGLPGLDLLDAEARAARDAVFGAAYSIHNMVPGDPGATLQYRWCVTREWKLLLRSSGLDTTRYRTVHEWDRVPARLWNLAEDPHATRNVLLEHPDVAAELRARVDAWLPAPVEEEEPVSSPVPLEDDGQRFVLPGLEVDREAGHVDLAATVCLRDGLLELVACAPGSKEHESILTVAARPTHVHAALLLLGLEPGAPKAYRRADEDSPWVEVPASGASMEVALVLAGEDERPLRDFLEPAYDGPRSMGDFLFTGSRLRERSQGPRKYLADESGHLLSLVSFGDEVLCLAGGAAHDAGTPTWRIDATHLPPLGAAVTLRLRPRDKQ